MCVKNFSVPSPVSPFHASTVVRAPPSASTVDDSPTVCSCFYHGCVCAFLSIIRNTISVRNESAEGI